METEAKEEQDVGEDKVAAEVVDVADTRPKEFGTYPKRKLRLPLFNSFTFGHIFWPIFI